MPHDNPSRESPLFSLGNQTLISVPMSALRAHWHSVRHRDRRAASATVCERGALQTGMVPSSARADTSGKQRPKRAPATTCPDLGIRSPRAHGPRAPPCFCGPSMGCRCFLRHQRDAGEIAQRPSAATTPLAHIARLAPGVLLVGTRAGSRPCASARCWAPDRVSATPAAQCRSSGLGGRSPAFVPQARPLTDPSCSTFDVRRHFRQLTR